MEVGKNGNGEGKRENCGKRKNVFPELLPWLEAMGRAKGYLSRASRFPPSDVLAGSSNDRVFAPDNVAKRDFPADVSAMPKKSREVGVTVSACVSAMGGGV